MAIQHWDRMDSEELLLIMPKKVCHEHFEESCFETELQENLGFRIRKHLKPDAVPTIFSFKPTQSHVQQERKERAQKRTKKNN